MQFHDIGKLTLAFVMLFAYFSFSQWLIIWSGNLPDEISWYLQRIRGWLGLHHSGDCVVPFRAALRHAAVARTEARRAAVAPVWRCC